MLLVMRGYAITDRCASARKPSDLSVPFSLLYSISFLIKADLLQQPIRKVVVVLAVMARGQLCSGITIVGNLGQQSEIKAEGSLIHAALDRVVLVERGKS